MNKLEFNLEETGLRTIFKDYQELAMKILWEDDGKNSREVYALVNDQIKISRASIITFLNAMVEEGYLTFEEKSGKGGYHKIYYTLMTEEDFRVQLYDKICKRAWEEMRK